MKLRLVVGLVLLLTCGVFPPRSYSSCGSVFHTPSSPQSGDVPIGVAVMAPPVPVTNLRVTGAVTGTDALAVTLRWSPPTDAILVLLRYANTRITQDSWGSDPYLGAPANSADIYTATVPYEAGATVFFALMYRNTEGWSGISNNAFWPCFDVYLPLILRSGLSR